MNDHLKVMKQCEAFLEGHFLLSSGRHSGGYCQCAKLLRFPALAEQVLSAVVEQVKNLPITKVCGPAMGGIIVSYELARQLGVESIFTERKDDVMQLRRGFSVGPGDRVLIAEDVITTGKSTMETVEALEAMGAEVIGAACIADRRAAGCDFPLPVYAALKLSIESYEADACPICQEGILPLEKPGSREMPALK
ncbi:MAG: orotate phosphoribosyltransferase [Eubacteriales bacterium]|nr:orotate phosphoribosyltransferase [Eubacteriales bacterium]